VPASWCAARAAARQARSRIVYLPGWSYMINQEQRRRRENEGHRKLYKGY
jgi:hypothetical protein